MVSTWCSLNSSTIPLILSLVEVAEDNSQVNIIYQDYVINIIDIQSFIALISMLKHLIDD